MDKITQALKKILPEDQVSEVAKAVEEVMAEQYKALEAEFNQKLEEAYEQIQDEKESVQQIAEQGYQQAYEMISSLVQRLDEQKEAFEEALEEGFEEAYEELQKEKGKNENIEVELYKEFDSKLKEMYEFMVDRVDQFLSLQETEMYEHAKRDVLSDPRIAEHRVTVAKIAELLSDHMSNEDYSSITSQKIEESQKQIEELKGQLRIVEAKNFRLSSQNNKLNEQVREANGLLTEATKVGRKERVNKARTASGRGQRVVSSGKEQIISEHHNVEDATNSKKDHDLMEDHDPFNDMLILSGVVQPE